MQDVGRGGVRELDELCDALLAHPFFKALLLDTDGGTVLDVAGGNGILSRTLADRGVRGLVVVDPKGLLPDADDAFDVAAARFREPKGGDDRWWHGGAGASLARQADLDELIAGARCLIGFRPCEATRAMVAFARRKRVPFALVPCCAVAPWRTLPSTLNGLRRECGGSVTVTRLPSGERFMYATTWDAPAPARRRRRGAPDRPPPVYRLA